MTDVRAPERGGTITPIRRGAATCRWATPALALPAPVWFDAERTPWICTRDDTLRALFTTDECATCCRWQPRRPGYP